jgi:hypothetical protein
MVVPDDVFEGIFPDDAVSASTASQKKLRAHQACHMPFLQKYTTY